MKKVVLLSMLISIFTSCKDDEEATVFDYNIFMEVRDKDGSDLVANGIIENASLTTYFLSDDGEFYANAKDEFGRPHDLKIYTEMETNEKKFSLSPNFGFIDNNKSVKVIEWGIDGYQNDTIEASYSQSRSAFLCTEVKLNGELVWSKASNKERTIQIIK